ncbi:MAG: glycosyltransferase family 1 protein [Candidatus Kapabacteria bacterium]|nr:glycosyltransferase family 1 protein [Candidatus Kapabacteria bacterium]
MIVAYDATSILGHSGIEVYARELIRGVSSLHLPDLRVVLMGRRRRYEALSEYFGSGVEIRSVLPHDLLLGEALRPIARLLQKQAWKKSTHDVDLVHMPGNTLWRVPSTPCVVTIHDVFPLMPNMGVVNKNRDEFHRHAEASSRAAKLIIVPTKWTAETLVEYLPWTEGKIRVVPHSIREKFHHSPMSNEKLESLGIPAGGEFLFFVGRVDPRKNLDRILEAWGSLGNEDCRDRYLMLVLSGDPDEIDGFRRVHRETLLDPSIIIKYGLSDDDIIGLYSSARALIFVSTAEGFGLPVLEAMQCGCPVLTSTSTCLPEVGGNAVLYADPFSVKDIAEGMLTLLHNNDVIEDLRRRGSERALMFSREAMARGTVDVYHEALGL